MKHVFFDREFNIPYGLEF